MQIGNVYIDPQQALEILGAVGGVGLTALFGLLFVRRVRARRLREIEGLEPPITKPVRRKLRAEDLEDEGSAEAKLRPGERRETDDGEEAADSTGEVSAPVAASPDVESAATTTSQNLDTGPTLPSGRRPLQGKPSDEPAPPAAEGKPNRAAGRVIEFPLPEAPARVPERVAKRSEPVVERRAPGEKPARAPQPEPPAPAPEAGEDAKPTAKERKANVWSPGLARTRSGWIAKLGQIFAGKREIDPALLDEIEKVLLTADIGIRTSEKLLGEMRASLSRRELADPDAAWTFLQRRSLELLSSGAPALSWTQAKPFVLLVIGVNGSGKTTTIGKLASLLTAEGKKVILGAGDTFRAAAAEQLEIWGNRTGVPVVRGKEGADPSSVLFDAIKRATNEGYDVVIGDTAGRLHTKTDLMEELQKVKRVIGKAAPGAPHETWLVIDSTSGQNAIAQAQIFTQAMAVSGIVLTKLDGTAKGGVILGIADQLQIPVRFIGIGERVEDLREFDAQDFVEALFERDGADAAAQATGGR